ncbi:hypothetical protein NQ314_005578 [Rhamnusium bicolor]|uniref:Uncharacterized protein n=1 Tax=Rhamnusium bicolor TaxID=1586634 RepID=A0AAV8ZJE8_9CUCU|nr:hypothetical protein NQ314_005578 [Rhamnusium bicolor]
MSMLLLQLVKSIHLYKLSLEVKQVLVFSVSKLTLPDEPDNVPIDIPEKLQTKTKLEGVYPVNSSAKQLKVIACKEVLDKKFNVLSSFRFGSKRFLKTATVVSRFLITYYTDIFNNPKSRPKILMI